MLIRIDHEEGNFGTAGNLESIEQASDCLSELPSIAVNPYFTKSQVGKLKKKPQSPSDKPKSLIGVESPMNPQNSNTNPKDPKEFQRIKKERTQAALPQEPKHNLNLDDQTSKYETCENFNSSLEDEDFD